MVGDAGHVPLVRGDADAGARVEHPRQLLGERAARRVGLGERGARVVGGGHEVPSGGLGQRLQEGDGEVVAQPGHLPVEAVGRHPVEHRHRDVDGDAVGGLARRELVGHVELEVALAPAARVVGRRHLLPRVGRQQVLGQREQVGPAPTLSAPPPVEVPFAHDVRRDAGVVEREHDLVVDDDVAPTRPLLELGDAFEGREVAPPELVLRLPVALDERRADEDLAGRLRVDPGVLDRAVGDERDAVERDPLRRHRGTGLAAPPGLADRARDDVGAGLLGPLGLDRGDDPGPEPRRLDELGRHDDVRLLAEQG